MKKKTLVWMIVSAVSLALVLTVNILATTMLYSVLNMVMPGGGIRARYADGIEPIYVSDFESKADAYQGARDFNVKLAEEGIVLLKNKNNALPIYTPQSTADKKTADMPMVSIFGKNSVDLAYGGTGSGEANTSNVINLYKALGDAGYNINPTLKAFYENTSTSAGGSGKKREPYKGGLDKGDTVYLSTAETPQSMYTENVKSSYSQYSDAAFIVFTRIAGEGFDLPRSMNDPDVVGARNPDDHFLQLDANETALLAAVCAAPFKKVIVLLNVATSMELGFLENPAYYAYQSKIDAAIWMGFPGETGTVALGNILNGNVNPSGRTVDTYAYDFKKDPTWNNFGDNRITGNYKKGILGGDQYYTMNGTNRQIEFYYFVHYEENIYFGYRYYETRAVQPAQGDAPTWYEDNVVYPFGHGMSYTQFSWEIDDKSGIENKTIAKDQKYTVKVKVTNNGSVAGKDVVQLYGHAPYTAGGLEKPDAVLLDFAKTDIIEPGNYEVVELVCDPYYLASYDNKDANANGFKGYEIEAGNGYQLRINRNSHDTVFTIPFVSASIRYDKDPVTDYSVKNLYTGQADYFNSDTQLSTCLSRANWNTTWPTSPTDESDRLATKGFINALKDMKHNNPNNYDNIEMPLFEEKNDLVLRDLLFDDNGKELDNDGDGIPTADYKDDRWELLLDKAKIKDLRRLHDYASYHTEAVSDIGLPRTNVADGPVGWVCFMDSTTFYGTCSYVAQSVVASTWNQKLIEEFGISVGNEGLAGNEKGDGMPYSGWYAPGANTHRSPFGGRNFEYYSEDPLLAGKAAAAQIKGVRSRGVFAFIKHFAVNDQETHRSSGGDCSWLTEQSLREIYLRPFEIAVKEGGASALMTSFNRIGTRWTGGDYRLLTEILRNEWGFRGAVINDFNTNPDYMDSRQMAYAGGDMNLATLPVPWCDESSAADVHILRQCVKNICYTIVNSNAMNGEIIGYRLPIWTICMIVFDCMLLAGLATWGVFVFKKAGKSQKK